MRMYVYRPNIDELLLGLMVFPSTRLIQKAVLYREAELKLNLLVVFLESSSSSMTFLSRSISSYAVLEVMGLLKFRI